MFCFLSMVMTTFSSETILTVLVLGRSTSIPDSRIGAVSMKMINSTSTTSTNGVILISEREDWVLPLGLVKAIVHLSNGRSQWPEFRSQEKYLLSRLFPDS